MYIFCRDEKLNPCTRKTNQIFVATKYLDPKMNNDDKKKNSNEKAKIESKNVKNRQSRKMVFI